MGLCGQLFNYKEENNDTNVANKNTLPDAISVNLNIPNEVNVNLHVYIHTVEENR